MITLFNGHSLTAKDRFQADKLGVQLSERQSTATLTLSDSAPLSCIFLRTVCFMSDGIGYLYDPLI